MLQNRIMISIPTDNPIAFRKALKAVAAQHGTNIGVMVCEVLLGSDYGDEFKAAYAKFVADSGYQKIQTDTIVDTEEKELA